MGGRSYRGVAALCIAIALIAGVTAGFGVFARGSGETRETTSIRGETYEYAIDGVYAYNAERVVAEGVGWDYVTLLFAVPVMLGAAPFVARGSLRGRLVAIGILTYFVYQYLMYAVFWALGPLFPLFIVLFASSTVTIVWLVSGLDVETLPECFTDRFPRRGMAIFSVLIALLLVGMWSQRIATGLSGDIAGAQLLGQPTLAVQAMDLGMIVPLAIATAILIWRARPWGYLLSTLLAVKGVTMAGAICAMLVSAAFIEGSLEVVPFAIFAAAALASGWLGVRMLGSVKAAS